MHLSGCEDTAGSRDGENVRCAGGGKGGGWDLPFWVYGGGEEASLRSRIDCHSGWVDEGCEGIIGPSRRKVLVEECWGAHGNRHVW